MPLSLNPVQKSTERWRQFQVYIYDQSFEKGNGNDVRKNMYGERFLLWLPTKLELRGTGLKYFHLLALISWLYAHQLYIKDRPKHLYPKLLNEICYQQLGKFIAEVI